MIVQSAFTLPLPMDAAFDLLVDRGTLASALPACRPDPHDPGAGELTADLGEAEVTIRGRLTAPERDRDAGALAFHAAGTDVQGHGAVTATGAVRLRQAENATAVAVQVEVEVSGDLARQGDAALEAAVRALLDGLAAGLRARALRLHPRPGGDVEIAGKAAVPPIVYAWMTSPAAADEPAAPASGDTGTPGPDGLASATSAGAARPRPAWSLTPATALEPRPRAVPGRVVIVTDGPIPARGIPVGDGALARARALHRARPWLAPALLITLLAVLLLLLRRRAVHRTE